MLSKEEAFVLPAVLTIWAAIDLIGPGRTGRKWSELWRRTWWLWVVAIFSLALRLQSGAMTPATAPPFYRYQFDVGTLADNTFSYLDRVGTTLVLALIVFWLLAGAPRLSSSSRARRIAVKGLAWLVLGFAPTVLLPVRSSLYAVMPSVGVTMILAAIVDDLLPRISPAALRRATVALTAVFVLLYPVYRVRNQRYASEADLSSSIVSELANIAASQPAGGLVVIRDVRTGGRPTAEQAFGPGADNAAALMTDRKFRLWIEPPPAELTNAPRPDLSAAIAVLTVESGTVKRTQ